MQDVNVGSQVRCSSEVPLLLPFHNPKQALCSSFCWEHRAASYGREHSWARGARGHELHQTCVPLLLLCTQLQAVPACGACCPSALMWPPGATLPSHTARSTEILELKKCFRHIQNFCLCDLVIAVTETIFLRTMRCL